MTLPTSDESVIIAPDRQESLINPDGSATERFYALLQALSLRVPIYGSGDPNGQYDANLGRLYVDIDGVSGQVLFKKNSNGGNTGWIPI